MRYLGIEVDDALSKQPLLRDIQYFKSEDSSGSLMVKRIHDLSIVEFLQELRDVGYRDMRDGVILAMNGEPVEANIESGRGLLIPVRGRIRGQQITGVVGAYSGHDGQGFLVIGTAKPQYWAAWSPRMKTMFNSVRFVEIDREAMVREWENRLKGKTLQYKHANVTRNPAAGEGGNPTVMAVRTRLGGGPVAFAEGREDGSTLLDREVGGRRDGAGRRAGPRAVGGRGREAGHRGRRARRRSHRLLRSAR